MTAPDLRIVGNSSATDTDSSASFFLVVATESTVKTGLKPIRQKSLSD